eukprot:8120960-Lingulodinium_polyedra.AAC.1
MGVGLAMPAQTAVCIRCSLARRAAARDWAVRTCPVQRGVPCTVLHARARQRQRVLNGAVVSMEATL